jgi:cytochrome P450
VIRRTDPGLDLDDVESVPFPPGAAGEAPAAFARRLDCDPLGHVVLPSGCVARAAVRYADVKTILTDHRFSRDLTYPGAPRVTGGDDIASGDPDLLVNMNPPRNTRLRRVAAASFTPRQAERWRPRVQRIADELLDTMTETAPPVDLVASFAYPLPIWVICELLGIPEDDWAKFKLWSEAAVDTSEDAAEKRMEAGLSFFIYIDGLLRLRREHPGDDVVSLLVNARDAGDTLTEEELIRLVIILIIAGHETTATVIGRGVFGLLNQRDAYRALVSDVTLVPSAVEEILRCFPPSDYVLLRVATEEVQLTSGTVCPGEAVLPSPAAANRDQQTFDKPWEFNPHRSENPHLAFGAGAHYCLGASLARMVLQVAVATLVSRLPGLELAEPADQTTWCVDVQKRSLDRLLVRW